MKMLKKALLSLAFMTAAATSITASAAVVTDSIARNPDELISIAHWATFTHDIGSGYTPASDRLLSAVLEVRLTDLLFNENYFITVGTGQLKTGSDVPNGTYNSAHGGEIVNFALNSASLADLAADGKISITVGTINPLSTFFFADSTLTAQVPEPLSIALMGIGFLGIGAARRKSAKNKAA
jgi:hypothetical protein